MDNGWTGAAALLLYFFEGLCVHMLFRTFAKPRLRGVRSSGCVTGIVWAAIQAVRELCIAGGDGAAWMKTLFFSGAVLLLFCTFFYRGDSLLKIFLSVQFLSLRELALWAGYSLIYIGNSLIDLLIRAANHGFVPMDSLPFLTGLVSVVFVAAVAVMRGVLLYVSVRRIASSCRCVTKGQMGREAVFYLLPALAGLLVAVLVRLLLVVVEDGNAVLLYARYPVLYAMIPSIALVLLMTVVFSFRLYEDMARLQQERAEKIVLENQIMQMQNSMTEMERLCDGIRAVKHDMKNQMAVLQRLIEKQCPAESGTDEQIRQYFSDMYESVEQLDMQVHTGNVLSDAVIGSKFCYAGKQMAGIRLDADSFVLSDSGALRAYDVGIILNNGLDNAIEACMQLHNKTPDAELYISVRSFHAKRMFFIEIENSFMGGLVIDADSGLPISTKENRRMHGIGLRNIKNCAARYGGDVDCIATGGKFILSVMVKDRQEETKV